VEPIVAVVVAVADVAEYQVVPLLEKAQLMNVEQVAKITADPPLMPD
jgi:hypothetical protein